MLFDIPFSLWYSQRHGSDGPQAKRTTGINRPPGDFHQAAMGTNFATVTLARLPISRGRPIAVW